MELTVLAIVIFAVFGIIDWKSLLRAKNKKMLIIYLILFISSFCVVFLSSLGVPIPGPTNVIESVFAAILGK